MKPRNTTGERSDKKALASIAGAGWTVSKPLRWVARKVVHEGEDESTTKLFESAFTLEALAKQVKRREAEEAR